jgi:hypothetical protein
MRHRLALIVTFAAALLGPVATANAVFVAGESIDGPSADIRSLGDLDVARDGGGAIAYVRRDGGVDHVFVSRLVSGAWQAPERVDVGLPGAAAQPVVAASDGGRVVVVYTSGGALFASVRADGAAAWSAPQLLAGWAVNPSVDMSINGTAYATFTSGGNVLAVRLERKATAFSGIDAPIDVDPPADAGNGAARSRVAISADATAVVVWGESGHVYARRLYRSSISTTPVDLSLPDLGVGHAGLGADLPWVAIEDDSSFAWIVFRQAFADGAGQTTHAIARRLRGSRLEGPVVLDPLGWGGQSAEGPQVAINGKGVGIATVGTTGGSALAGVIKDDILNGAIPIGGDRSPTQPAGAVTESGARAVGWINPGEGTVHGAIYDDNPAVRSVPFPTLDTVLSNNTFGLVDATAGFDMAADRTGDIAYAFIQGSGDSRRLVTSAFDRPPGSIFGHTSSRRWHNVYRDAVSWSSAPDLWGPITYTLYIDGKPLTLAGKPVQTTKPSLVLPAGSVPEGVHRWRVMATDRRGQSVTTVVKPLRIDTVAPRVKVKVDRSGRTVKVTAKVSDVLPPSGRASGVDSARIAFGDGAIIEHRSATHTYRRDGSFTIKVTGTDHAGNATVVERKLKVEG